MSRPADPHDGERFGERNPDQQGRSSGEERMDHDLRRFDDHFLDHDLHPSRIQPLDNDLRRPGDYLDDDDLSQLEHYFTGDNLSQLDDYFSDNGPVREAAQAALAPEAAPAASVPVGSLHAVPGAASLVPNRSETSARAFRQPRKSRLGRPHTLGSWFLRASVYLSASAAVGVLLFIVGYIFAMGLPHISPDLFALTYNSTNVSLMPALINTLLMTVLALLIAVPLGLGAAIYLTEYAGRGNRLVNIVRITAETLAGIPSIVYGLFGLLFFVTYLGWRMSILAGAFTLALMILPLVMRTSEEALKAVPDLYREGSFGLGAGRLRTVLRVLIPSAAPGILAGILLGIGRIVGESAALIYTAGTVAAVPESLFDSTRTLSVHMYVLASEGLHIDKTYATAVVLLLLVLLINTMAAMLARRLTAKG
ncbi:MAG: phosphate ABC transporter permease PstA [Coriobacteriales bacterium]|jgi:phosphate transport system permease protein|nr:phosphate ABC transporter permease PstA [Coriobacteriales bacterium]